ncbi:MAG TPA: hypothetical protein VFD92_10930 [Candidatus Binatia bacterium]|nr:hypothetical protein [Candidatus Binatia bacterium]
MQPTSDRQRNEVGLFLDMDKMIGDRFEQGLADMKAAVERTAGRS